ncbi:MAG: sulfurtransferase [Hyphomicrobiales bacterium]|nr:sulfurtransferase [Hyphomicrobiales bacterium]
METLVSTEWLARHLADGDLVVLDCSVHTETGPDGAHNTSGLADYRRGHIPSAGFADLKGDLCDGAGAVEFTPPSPAEFCAAMGRLGVGDDTRVVLYDSSFSAWAARVWWMLRWVGFDQAALLDGGLAAWNEDGRALSTDAATAPARRLTPRPRDGLIADRAEVMAAITNPGVVLIDAMPAPMYQGEMTMYARPGHIPTAVNIPGTDLLDEKGRFRPEADLEAMHERGRSARAITYCGGGILASLNAFVMTRLGFQDIAVYTASLQEWAADPSCPMTVDTP